MGGRKPNNFTYTLLEVAPSVVLAPLPLPLASVLRYPPKSGSPSRLRTSYVYAGDDGGGGGWIGSPTLILLVIGDLHHY